MGYDDGVCEQAPDGMHDLQLVEITAAGERAGLAQVRACRWCGVPAYEASAADDPRRRPLPPV